MKKSKSLKVRVNSSKMGNVESIFHTLIDDILLILGYDLVYFFYIISFHSRKQLRIGKFFLLNLLYKFIVFIAENQRIKFILKILSKLIEETIVELYK